MQLLSFRYRLLRPASHWTILASSSLSEYAIFNTSFYLYARVFDLWLFLFFWVLWQISTNFFNILLYNLYRLYWKEVTLLKKRRQKKRSTNVIAKFLHKILDCLKIILKIAQVLKAIFDVFHWNSKKQALPHGACFF